MAEIKKTDIAEKGVLDGFIKDATKGIKAIDEFNKSLEDSLKLQSEFIKQGKKDTTSKGLKTQAENFKKVDNTIKTLNETRKISLQLDKEREKAGLKLKKLNSDRIQETVQLNRLAKEQNAINKDAEIINNKSAGTLEKIAARSRQLRREREKLNLDTEKGRKRLKEINAELDKNNKKVLQSADALKKQSLNVGNYTSSIKEAAEASGLFGGVLGKLNQIQGVLNALTKKNVVAEQADVVAKEAQAASTTKLTFAQRALNLATGKGTKALKLFKTALIGTGVGALVVALGGLVAFLTRSQSGVDGLSKAFAGFSTGLDVVIDRFSIIGEGIADIFSGNISEGLDKIKNSFNGITEELEKEVKLATELKELTIQLTREQKLFEAEQSASLTLAKEQALISRDKLKSDVARVAALEEANRIEVEIAEKQLVLQEAALAASLDSFDKKTKTLQLDKERLDFIQKIKDGEIDAAEAVQQAADFTLSSAAGEEALFEIIEKIKEQEQARQSLLDKRASTIKRLSALQVQIATKNATASQQEAALQRELFKDEDLQLEKRIEAIELARDLDIEANKFRLDANIINEREFQARKLSLAKKTEEEIQKLLAKSTGVDTDFDAIAKKQVKVVNQIEQELLQQQINNIERRLQVENITQQERVRLINERAEIERTKLQSQSDFIIATESKTQEEIELLNIQTQGKLNEIENNRVDSHKQANEEILQSDKELQSQREIIADARIDTAKNVADIIGVIGNEDSEAQKRLQQAIAISEININAQREISKIREEYVNNDAVRRNKILQARTAQFAGVAQVLSAFDGVDDTGGRGNVDSKGGKTWTLHPHEQVHSLKDRKDMADPITGKLRNREEIKNLVNLADNLMLSPHVFKSLDAGQLVSGKDINSAMFAKGIKEQTKELKKAFKEGQTTYNVAWNKYGEVVSEEIKNGITKRFRHKKSRL